mgnify:CR=1 FL=1
MNDERQRIAYLLERYADKVATEQEENELFALIGESDNEPAIKSFLLQLQEGEAGNGVTDRRKWEPVLQRILAGSQKLLTNEDALLSERNKGLLVDGRKGFGWRKIAAAVAVIILGTGAHFMFFNKKPTDDGQQSIVKGPTDVKAPETNRAMITLADGRTVYLDSAANGQLAMQGNVRLVKLANGQIQYSSESGVQSSELVYNTLMNPKGSKVIDMALADGSHVWLNAGSSVTFPVAFAGNERKVFITGEAYFEVAHDVTKPFYVTKGDVSVQVLGTHFNVNAYDDEKEIKVTLLEGSVKVTSTLLRNDVMIKPGQQATLRQGQGDKELKVVNGVDMEQVMAWKNGYFSFDNTDLETVMRQIARWYDVEVVYEGAIPDMQFGGDISRNNNASQVLKILEESKVKFRIEGKKIVVMK